MRFRGICAAVVTLGACLVSSYHAYGAPPSDDDAGSYRILSTIGVPSGLSGFDISWVDQQTGRFYVTDHGNPTASPAIGPSIDVIDLRHAAYLYSIPTPSSGNGVLTLHRLASRQAEETTGELWAGFADSAVRVWELANPFGTPFTISTGGTGAADELAYDPLDQIIAVANNADTPPYITFISAKTRTVLGKLVYPQAVVAGKNNGLEQTIWDGVTQRFYLSVPGTTTNPGGEVDEINARTMKVTQVIPTTCSPKGLAVLPRNRIMTSCGDVLNVVRKQIVATVAGVAGDEIWYDAGDDRVYFAHSTYVTAVDALNYTVYAPVTVSTSTSNFVHTIASDSESNRVGVPVAHVGVVILTDQSTDGDE